ncbi:MAG TPA: HupE/UreJ family protein [Terriglobales bacterium]|nr:HupE/UreJ family protein [Terriglobales bacterium]
MSGIYKSRRSRFASYAENFDPVIPSEAPLFPRRRPAGSQTFRRSPLVPPSQRAIARMFTRVLLMVFVLATAAQLRAHTSLPGYLELKETTPGAFNLTWRLPTAEGPPPAIYPILPKNCVTSELISETAPASVLERGTVKCGSQGLANARIEIAGLNVTILDVLVRITFADGTTVSHMLKPLETSWMVQKNAGSRTDAWGYFGLGISHILYGIDHLLFVLGLLLIVPRYGLLLKTITAFTVAHTITLALAVFGVVHVAPTPVEAVIALSIIFLAVELAQHHRGREGVTFRKPWIVAFAFGLLHGFGFAGTLSRVGIPAADVPPALLFFNLGVEAGQLAFVAVFLGFVSSLKTLEIRWPAWTRPVPAYALGSVASFWLVQRCVLMF